MFFYILTIWLSFGLIASAGTIPVRAEPLPPSHVIAERQASSSSSVPDGQCTNGPETRNCWSSGFSIATDFDAKSPPAGNTVTYNWEITNTTKPNPDGSGGSRIMMLVNGVYPGPVLRASWGDTVIVNVKNSLEYNGTSIHWHGVRQLDSCQQDGVPGVTECPIAPGTSRQYKFHLTQFGTSWYHSHFSSQYGDGVLGPIIIDGPATTNYDEDLGALPITDWYYTPVMELNDIVQHSRTGPPAADNILVNGTHVNKNGGGSYAKMNVVKGKRYRIRIINTSVDMTFSFSLDGHPFTVITSDFVPIEPWVTDQLTITMGQRYDVVINANQTVDNYWFRVSPGTDCGENKIAGTSVQIGAILHYNGASNANPTSTTDVTMRTSCNDESTSNLIPFWKQTVPSSVVSTSGEIDINYSQNSTNDNLFRWLVDGTPMIVDWSAPTLQTVLAGSSSFPPDANVHQTPTDGWYFWHIQNVASIEVPHPIHLHGHDYYIVGSGSGTWDGSTTGLNFNNPTRRDTALLPAGGYLLIAFPENNPGMWILHCHIAWHVSEGLSLEFLARESEIKGAIGDTSAFTQGCKDWNSYWYPGNPKKPYNQTDSGI